MYCSSSKYIDHHHNDNKILLLDNNYFVNYDNFILRLYIFNYNIVNNDNFILSFYNFKNNIVKCNKFIYSHYNFGYYLDKYIFSLYVFLIKHKPFGSVSIRQFGLGRREVCCLCQISP